MTALPADEVLQRIWAEYAEMPDLSLTPEQGCRLWGLDRVACDSALETLTTAGFLRKSENGHYSRATDGRTPLPTLRMARADATTIARPAKASGSGGSN